MFGSNSCSICFVKLVLLYLFWQAAAAFFGLLSSPLLSSPLLFAYDEIVISIYYLK